MVVTLSGMVILVNFLQPAKADEPMVVTSSPRVMFVMPLQFLNAPVGMYPPVTVTDLSDDGI